MIVVKAIEAFAVVMIAFILGWALVDWSEVKELRKRNEILKKDVEFYKRVGEQIRDTRDFLIKRNKKLDDLVAEKAEEIERLQNELDALEKETHTLKRNRRIKFPIIEIHWYDPRLIDRLYHEGRNQ